MNIRQSARNLKAILRKVTIKINKKDAKVKQGSDFNIKSKPCFFYGGKFGCINFYLSTFFKYLVSDSFHLTYSGLFLLSGKS